MKKNYILNKNPAGSKRVSGTSLKREMLVEGVEYACVKCGNTGEWMGEPLTLDVDHISGDITDNRLRNLRFLCPNCHRQTETFGSGNTQRAREQRRIDSEGGRRYCVLCDEPLEAGNRTGVCVPHCETSGEVIELTIRTPFGPDSSKAGGVRSKWI